MSIESTVQTFVNDNEDQAQQRRDRVAGLVRDMTLPEKLAQLVGLWTGVDAHHGETVAPFQDSMQNELLSFEEFSANGLGQITRYFGTAPVEPAIAARALAARQDWLVRNTRHGIPAMVHEECLTGLAAWKATSYASPPAWGATFNPELLKRIGRQIGLSMRSLGVHQGLAPVVDVIRDMRWGRVEECIAEDPYLVGRIATSYVQGLQGAGVVATLKHFVGYSNSRAGRNLAPVYAGPREVRDVLLLPFEMAILDGNAGSVMNSYSEIDGIPVAADESLLTDVLRDAWGFEGTVVADYFAIAFLHTLHCVAADITEAGELALTAGIDVELPTGVAYRQPMIDAIESGRVDIEFVDRALVRVLNQKASLGLLDPDYDAMLGAAEEISLDGAGGRALAAELAEQSVILLSNPGILPLAPGATRKIAVVGPNASDPSALFGCYAFANHVLPQHPGFDLGIVAPTVLEMIEAEFQSGSKTQVAYARGCDVDTDRRDGFAEATALAESSDVCIAVVGDRAGLFGRGTSGEGSDVENLELPGVQREFVENLLTTGTPVIVVLMTGRGYAIDWAVSRTTAIIQAFFPGEEGAQAIAGVLSGRVNPSGKLPMSLARSGSSQPYSYLHPKLGGSSSVSNIETEPAFAFGHGLSYTSFAYADFSVESRAVPTSGSIRCQVTVTNSGPVAGAEVVELYGSDPFASVTRATVQLAGFHRLQLEPGQSATVHFDVPARQFAFSDKNLKRIVEPGAIEISLRRSALDVVSSLSLELIGDVHFVTNDDRRIVHTWLD